MLRAVAQAHRQTGVPISTHTHAATRRGLEQQRIFAEEGVDLSRVVIGHCGDTTDIGYLEELIANGSYIGMDRFGVDVYPAVRGPGRHRGARCASAATPTRWCCPTTPRASSTALPEETAAGGRCRTGTTCTSTTTCSPRCEQRGVTDEQITTMLVDNPRRIFATQGGY